MKQWTVTESQNTILEDFQLDWLPDEAYNYITPRFKHLLGGRKVIEINAGSYVGSFPLLNGDIFRIVPQIGEGSFWRMLLFAEGLDKEIKDELEDLTESGHDEEGESDWAKLLAKSFIRHLQTIEKNSLQHGRKPVRERNNYAKGKILAVPTMLSLARFELNPVHSIVSSRTYDLAEHRFLGMAARKLFYLGLYKPEHKSLLIRWMRFAEKPLSELDFRDVIIGLKAQRFTGSRAYYIPALVQARLLLSESGISFSEDTVETAIWLTNIRTVYEKYLFRVVQSILHDSGFIAEKREDTALTLFADGTLRLIPDILVSKYSKSHLIIDAKYKVDKPLQEADVYQMMVYLQAYEVESGILVMPTRTEHKTIVHKTILGKIIHEVRIPLGDWRHTESILEKEIKELIGIA